MVMLLRYVFFLYFNCLTLMYMLVLMYIKIIITSIYLLVLYSLSSLILHCMQGIRFGLSREDMKEAIDVTLGLTGTVDVSIQEEQHHMIDLVRCLRET